MADCFNISLRGTTFTTNSVPAKDFMDKLTKDGRAVATSAGNYFVDRNSVIFHHVLDYWSGRTFHLPKGICAVQAREEIEFWMIPLDAIPKCCYEVLYNDNLSSYEAIENLEEHLNIEISPVDKEAVYRSKFQNIREILNMAAAHPGSSLLGKVWLFLVALCTFITIACFLLNTHSEFRVPRRHIPAVPDNITYNLIYGNPKLTMIFTKTIPMERIALDIISNALLLMDICLRFLITRQKKAFVLNIQNILEMIASVVSFVIIGADNYPRRIINNGMIAVVFGLLFSLRSLKLLRLADTTSEMKILKLCIQNQWKIIALLMMVFTIFSVTFGTAMFWAEFDNADTFPNAFISIWWAVVTITTVGYGDHYPKTPFGYIMAAVTALFGLLLLAIPIAALSSDFSTFYNCYTYRKKHNDAKKK